MVAPATTRQEPAAAAVILHPDSRHAGPTAPYRAGQLNPAVLRPHLPPPGRPSLQCSNGSRSAIDYSPGDASWRISHWLTSHWPAVHRRSGRSLSGTAIATRAGPWGVSRTSTHTVRDATPSALQSNGRKTVVAPAARVARRGGDGRPRSSVPIRSSAVVVGPWLVASSSAPPSSMRREIRCPATIVTSSRTYFRMWGRRGWVPPAAWTLTANGLADPSRGTWTLMPRAGVPRCPGARPRADPGRMLRPL